MSKRVKRFISIVIIIILAFFFTMNIFSSTKTSEEKSKGFCVVYAGRKILKDVQSFEISAADAVFRVETIAGDPIKDYSVAVRASRPTSDFNVVFNDVDVQSWENDFAAVNYEFSSAGIEKNEDCFTIKNTRLLTILDEEFPGMNIRYENLISTKNVLQIDVTVSGQTLSIMYFAAVAVSGIELSQGVIIC